MWTDQASLDAFASADPHRRIIEQIRPRLDQQSFAFFTLCQRRGSEVLDNTARPMAARVRAALERDDDYATADKPPCDWDDPADRELLVDELVHDALAALAVLDGERLGPAAKDAADLLAIVAGQDVASPPDCYQRNL